MVGVFIIFSEGKSFCIFQDPKRSGFFSLDMEDNGSRLTGKKVCSDILIYRQLASNGILLEMRRRGLKLSKVSLYLGFLMWCFNSLM